MFCTFTAYADDAPPAEDSTQTAAEEETHDVVQVQGVQTYDPQLYEQLNTLQESVNALVDVLKSDEATEDTEPGIWDKSFNDYTPLEGYALLTFVVVLPTCFIVIFRRY